ncbi:beta-scruin isoform X2 [Parasteatoda tepidariorum]|uniref:beta-scruin isoform X2 n=1 Tax=Parasteatoda tepidariorum TaxID=114398 RepID=UPI001C71C6C4|nr:alpha-scruin isoform X2 [Parasteatoda tepidariorum]
MYRKDKKPKDSDQLAADFGSRWRRAADKDNEKSPKKGKTHREDDERNDYETYAYEYQDKSSPRGRDSRTRTSPQKHHFPERAQPWRTGRTYNQGASGSSHREINREQAMLNLAATKIQAAFKGHVARKHYWRELERHRGLQNSIHSYKADEISIPSETSVVGSSSLIGLAANADPNLGLTAPLPTLDHSQKSRVIRDLKSRLNFSEEISSVFQLQSEFSPTVVIFGGLNPYEPRDYLLGGSMFVYNVKKDKWYFGGTMLEPRNYHGAVYLNGKIYITGGYSPLQVSNGQMLSTQSLFQLTVRSQRWRIRADMHQARACHGTCVIDENIMVMGGRDNFGKLLSTVELYYTKKDQWVLVKPMPEAIMGMACAVLDHCVWVIGGIVNEGHSSRYAVSNRVYVFDIQQQSWFHKPSLPEARAFSSAASLKREIWLWCGVRDALNEDGYLLSTNTVFVFNPEITKWEHHTSLATAKHGTAVAKFGRRVYLLGGMNNVFNSKEVLNENDFYNREIDKFTEGASLPRPVTGAAAIALPIDYIATSDPKWNYENIDEGVMNEAATKIQAVFRGHRTRSLISHNKYPLYTEGSDIRRKLYAPQAEVYSDKWKLFQRVQIDDWPPLPDPKTFSSELNIRLGTLPKGYTVSPAKGTSRTKVKRYLTLPEEVDPNLGICGHIGNIFKKTKKILGLRRVDHIPPFARDMRTVTTLQDDSFPVVLVMGGLQPREPVNMIYGKLILLYHPLKNRWEYFGVLPEPRNYHAAVYHREFIYVTGGCDPDKRNCGEMVSTKTVFCLNIHSSEWVQKSDMLCTRSHHSLVAYQDKIFAIGGRDNNGRWLTRPPLRCPRTFASCVVVHDSMWLFGGASKHPESRCLISMASVDKYYANEAQWMRRTLLNTPRHGAAVVAVESCVYTFGGVCSQEWGSLAKNEMVVIDDVSLHSCADLPLPLTGLAAVVIPPISPSLRPESVALLLHAQLTFN